MIDAITGLIGPLDWKHLWAVILKLALIIALGFGILSASRSRKLREEPADFAAFAWMILSLASLLLTDARELTSGLHIGVIGMGIGIASGRLSLHREFFAR